MRRALLPVALLVVPGLTAVAACDETDERLDAAGARAAAETMRAVLRARQLPEGETVRSVAVLRDAARRIPGSPSVEGIADADGDGKDDDGKVTIGVGDEHACVTAADNGRVDVTDDRC